MVKGGSNEGKGFRSNFVRLPAGDLLNLNHLVWVSQETTEAGEFECSLYLDADTFAHGDRGIHLIGDEAELFYKFLEQRSERCPEGPGPIHGRMIFVGNHGEDLLDEDEDP